MKILKIAIFLVLIAITLFTSNIIDNQFRFRNITDEAMENYSFPLDIAESKQLQTILGQPYLYLDRGRQSFVFESQDKQYVIKFFDLHRYQPTWFTSISKQSRMKRKMAKLFHGYRVAYDHNRDNAMIIFLQLVPNPLLKQSIDLSDRFGFRHNIDLSKVPFVIQYKGITTRVEMSRLLGQGDVAAAKKCLRHLVDMYLTEYKRGIYDRDHNFMYNTGFVNGSPMRLDVGKLRLDPHYKDIKIALEDLEKIVIHRTQGWLQRHFPQYRDEIIEDMHLRMAELREYLQSF